MKYLLLLALVIQLSGCATIFNGTKSTIYVRSEEPDTSIYIDEIYIGKNTGSYNVSKKGDHYITVRKEGCEERRIEMNQTFDPVSLLGILIDFGIISMLIVDGAATGAITDFDQKSYVLSPDCPKTKGRVSLKSPLTSFLSSDFHPESHT
jgi:hypothetical protein